MVWLNGNIYYLNRILYLSVCGFVKFLKFLNILFNCFYFSINFLFYAILRKSPNHDWKCRAFFISSITWNLLLLNIFVTKNISDCYFKKVDFDYSLSGPHIFDRHNNKIAITSSFYSLNPFNKSNFNSAFIFDSYDESDFLQGLYNPCKYVDHFLPFFINTIPFSFNQSKYFNNYFFVSDFCCFKTIFTFLSNLKFFFQKISDVKNNDNSMNGIDYNLPIDRSYIHNKFSRVLAT